jgi:hypothetical protein
MYGGIGAVVTVLGVMASFVIMALNEDSNDPRSKPKTS